MQQLEHLVKVARRHGADKWDLMSQPLDDVECVFIVRPAVVIQILLHELEALRDAGGHRRLDTGPVTRKLVDHELRYKQIDVTPVSEHAERHDPALSIAPLGQIEPGGGINE